VADDLAAQGFAKKLGPIRSTAQWWNWMLNKKVARDPDLFGRLQTRVFAVIGHRRDLDPDHHAVPARPRGHRRGLRL
jgi:hypothetical protein